MKFICFQCKNYHNKEKDSHKTTVPFKKIKYTCLEHGKKFISYYFICIVSICTDCGRSKKHCVKPYICFETDKEFLLKIKYHFGEYSNYV